MRLSKHFDLAEFTASDTAARLGINNSLPDDLLIAAHDTAEMMERIRAMLGDHAIIITSGYRCQDLNAAIGSKRSSDHPKAMAIDFKCPEFGTPYEVAKHLAGKINPLGVGQLIYEFGPGGWIHVSTRTPDNAANRVITINKAGAHLGIQP